MSEPKIVEAMGLSYPFVRTDGGRAEVRHAGLKIAKVGGKPKGDCIVRALAVSTGRSYLEALESLREETSINSGTRFERYAHALDWQEKDFHGFTFERMAFPAVKGSPRMNPATFCREYPEGRFICKTAKHVFAVIDGVVYDSWIQRPDRCIYTAWKLVIKADLS